MSATARVYMIVAADEPVTAAAAVSQASTPPISASRARRRGRARPPSWHFAGRYVTTIDEPLLDGRRADESAADFAGRWADALRVLYALDTRSALVISDALGPVGGTALVLDEASVLRIAEWIESEVPRLP